MLVFLIVALVLAIVTAGLIFRSPVFGSDPSDKERQVLAQSPQFRGGRFHNLSVTPIQVNNSTMVKAMREFYGKRSGAEPRSPVPVMATKVESLTADETTLIWFGHSSYFIRMAGINLLVDPVFSGHASPFPFFARAFPGTSHYRAADFTDIGAVLITHDHYDHLDHNTIRGLIPLTRKFYTSLGVGSHLRHWGVPASRITELDWWDSLELTTGLRMTAAPARHFSGRRFKRFSTLWSSFALEGMSSKLYLGSDSGYDTHFREIGKRFGSFDIALLECGQYNAAWPYIHMTPEETVKAAQDINASVLMPVHWGKFRLAPHSWKDPIERASKAADLSGVKITTPMIGEPLVLGQQLPTRRWWDEVD